jgi:glycosyltransferase involved in cell wall biosynthesis
MAAGNKATIVYVIPGSIPGSEVSRIQLMNRAAREGFSTVLITGLSKQVLDATTLLCDEAHYVSALHGVGQWWEYLAAFIEITRIFFDCASRGPLVVHTYGTSAGFLGRWAAWIAGARATIHAVDSFAFSSTRVAWRWWISYWAEYVTSWVTSEYVCATMQCRDEGIQYLPYFRQRCSVIRSGAQWQEYYVPARKEQVKPSRDVVVGSVVPALASVQEVLDFVMHLAVARDEGVLCRLELIGEGKWLSAIEAWRQTTDDHEWVSVIAGHAHTASIMQMWDVYAALDQKGGLSASVVHARLARIPVVAYRAGSVSELVKHEKNGLLADPHDVQSLVSGVAQLVADADLRRQYGECNESLNEFNSVFIGARHMRLYKNLLSMR